MNEVIGDSFKRLQDYCEKEGFKGWDPYDGLTSKIFQAIPGIRSNRFFRLAWIQFFKRSPVNFRLLALVPKQYNSKGLALFLTGYCNLYKISPSEETMTMIHFLAEKIISLQSPGYSGSCWGYYFDWQARAFFQPKNTPTVVATSFVVDSLLNAWDLTRKDEYRQVAVSSTQFVLKDLNRTYDSKGNFSFSYSPADTSQVFNASLLGARLLSRVYSYTLEEQLSAEARKAIAFVCDHQNTDGSWSYGLLPYHSWIDSFHTGFNLECIFEYQAYTADNSFRTNIEWGFNYYVNNFFTEEGASRYYNDRLYPVDIHAPAQFITTLARLKRLGNYQVLAEKVLTWTIQNMQSEKGYFYYQKKKGISSKVPYMRWAQAWMFYAMSYYLLASKERNA